MLESRSSGLSQAEAEARLERDGANEPAPPAQRSVVRLALSMFANPLVLMLLAASAVSALVGEHVDAGIIAAMVLLGVTLNFLQTFRSQRALDRLRAGLVPTATVLRDGSWRELPRRDVVRGDILRLDAGDLVAADARLLEAKDLHANQAALTGESFPVEKEASDAHAGTLLDDPGAVLFGTSIVSGDATAVVVATGRATAFGDVAATLAARVPETEFERGSRRFGMLIVRTVIALVLFIFISAAVMKKPAFESLMFALALAVGLTPEFLPMITAVTLSSAATQMARRNVMVKNLSAIQNLGSMDILCSDKTGTLTSGEMVLQEHVDPLGHPSERVLRLAYLNSLYETGVATPHDVALRAKGRSPLDTAILLHQHPDVRGSRKLDEVPFDFERRRMSIVVELDGKPLLIVKGAPESVLTICTRMEIEDRVVPLSAPDAPRAHRTFQRQCAVGYRVLAVAYREIAPKDAYGKDDERDLVLAGFVAFADPPLEDAAAALMDLKRDGVEVKILTGDHEDVARHVCDTVGLFDAAMVRGDALAHVSDAALGALAERTTVFARVSPAQKNRVLLALKGRGHVVGFLGDGINDAPSIHAADVGISVSTAVDVAREAAEIILLKKGLRVIHTGIAQGRRAFGNVIKYLLMGTSSNFGNMFSMAGAFLFLPFLPMLPTQILLNNFLYDVAQLTIPTDNVDEAFVVKPRRWNISLLRNFMVVIGPISSLFDVLTFWVLLRLFHADPTLFHTGWFVESLFTQTLVIGVIRTFGNPLKSRPSVALQVTTLGAVLVALLLPVSPLAKMLGFTPLPLAFLGFVAAATLTYLAVVAGVRTLLFRRAFA